MCTRPIIAILVDHYKRILDELQGSEAEQVETEHAGATAEAAPVAQERPDLLRAIETCLRLVEPTCTHGHLRPKKKRAPPKMPYGQLLHDAYENLRPAETPYLRPRLCAGFAWPAN